MKSLAFHSTANFVFTSFAVILEYALLRIIAALLTSLHKPLPYIYLFLAVAFLFFICTFYARKLRMLVTLEKMQDLRSEVLDSCLFLNNKNDYENVNSVLNKDSRIIASFYGTEKPIFVSNLILYGSVLFFLFTSNLYLAFCILVISFLCITPDLILRKYFMQTYWDTREVEKRLSNYFIEAFNLNAMINLYRVHSWFFKRFYKITDEFYKLGNKAELFAKLEDFLHNFSEVVITLLSYLLIAYFKTKEIITVQEAISTAAILPVFFSRTVMMFSIIGAKNSFNVSLKRFQNLVNKNTDIKSSSSKFTKIEYKDVLPSYLKEKLKPVSFCINKNDKVLIKGENGIGKTSLIKCLFCGIEYEGIIEIETESGIKNSMDISENCFIKNCIYLPQDFPLLSLKTKDFINTVAEKNDIDIKALKEKFKVYGFEFETHKHTKIKDLSGGEKKKLLLPLAFMLNKIVILDEPTNDLDSQGISALKKDLTEYKNTLMVISHDKDIESCFFKILNIGKNK
ncbi:ATP-binding cassette domain-containing protein [Treponema pedis]|uniref:ATP-binding cassette domain-containing protein n=1 Tax=Treponema pedis TaxID=409322 RepID=UPI0003F90CB5|nr:ABC transporter ATP-binding protein [Treponema pedis]